jgi:hypothetical protein
LNVGRGFSERHEERLLRLIAQGGEVGSAAQGHVVVGVLQLLEQRLQVHPLILQSQHTLYFETPFAQHIANLS